MFSSGTIVLRSPKSPVFATTDHVCSECSSLWPLWHTPQTRNQILGVENSTAIGKTPGANSAVSGSTGCSKPSVRSSRRHQSFGLRSAQSLHQSFQFSCFAQKENKWATILHHLIQDFTASNKTAAPWFLVPVTQITFCHLPLLKLFALPKWSLRIFPECLTFFSSPRKDKTLSGLDFSWTSVLLTNCRWLALLFRGQGNPWQRISSTCAQLYQEKT